MSKKSEGMEKIEKRLQDEERRDQEHAKEFPKLSKAILEGTPLSEDMVIRAVDGKKYHVTIQALSEGEIIEALDKSGLEFHDLGNAEKIKANIKFQHTICAKSLGGEWTTEELAKILTLGQSGKLTVRILALSGLGSSPELMDSFRST